MNSLLEDLVLVFRVGVHEELRKQLIGRRETFVAKYAPELPVFPQTPDGRRKQGKILTVLGLNGSNLIQEYYHDGQFPLLTPLHATGAASCLYSPQACSVWILDAGATIRATFYRLWW